MHGRFYYFKAQRTAHSLSSLAFAKLLSSSCVFARINISLLRTSFDNVWLSDDPAYLYKCFHLIIYSGNVHIVHSREKILIFFQYLFFRRNSDKSKHKEWLVKFNSIEYTEIYIGYFIIYMYIRPPIIGYQLFIITWNSYISAITEIANGESNIYSLTFIIPLPLEFSFFDEALPFCCGKFVVREIAARNSRNSESKITEITEKNNAHLHPGQQASRIIQSISYYGESRKFHSPRRRMKERKEKKQKKKAKAPAGASR